jgi:NaMN:DMB phosphoribosyltransferase
MAVDLGAAAAVAEIGMHAVGEVDRRRPARQIDHLALRRDDVERLVERGLLVVADPVGTVGDFVLPGQQLAQPGDLLVVIVLGVRLLPSL